MASTQHRQDYFDHLDQQVVHDWDAGQYSGLWGDSMIVLMNTEIDGDPGESGYATPTDSDAGYADTDGMASDDDREAVGGEFGNDDDFSWINIDDEDDDDDSEDISYDDVLRAYYQGPSTQKTFDLVTFMETYEISNFEIEDMLSDEEVLPPYEQVYMQSELFEELNTEALDEADHLTKHEKQHLGGIFRDIFPAEDEILEKVVLASVTVNIEADIETEDECDDDFATEPRARRRRLNARRNRRHLRGVRRRATF